MVRESRESFYNSLDDNFLTNPKRFWSIFKLNNKRSSVPDIMSMGNAAEPKPSQPCTVSTPMAIANLFNRYFTSVFNNDDENPVKRSSVMSTSPTTSEHFDLQLSTEEVARTLLALDSTKATGPDEIPSRLLKDTARQIAPSLTQIFNKSLCLGEIPDEWKLANIVPIHKKGDKSQVENYRPISLLSLDYVHTVTFSHGFVLFHNPKGVPIYFQTIENDAKTLPCAHSLSVESTGTMCPQKYTRSSTTINQ